MDTKQKKQLVEKLIQISEENIYRGELEKRFANRMIISGKNKQRYDGFLKQATFLEEEERERLKTYQDALKELNDKN